MAEIKLNDNFLTEVEAFRGTSDALKTTCSLFLSAEELDLPTVEAYQKRLTTLRAMMIMFGMVIKKDADDMEALAARLKAADATGS